MPKMKNTTKIRVRYNECDSSGYAFNANFFVWMQEGSGDLFEMSGIDVLKLALDGHTFMAVHMECDFKRPVRFRDVLDVRASVRDVGESSLHIQYDIYKDDQLMAIGRTVHVYVDTNSKTKIPIPDNYRKRLLSNQ
jgi:acyl-CoA thioester hydrolase